MTGSIVTTFAFLTGFLGICGLNLVITDIFLKDRERAKKRMEAELRSRERSRTRSAIAGQDLSRLAEEAFREAQTPRSPLARLDELVEQSGLEIKVSYVLAACIGLASVVALASGFATGSAIVGVALGLVVSPLPVLYIQFKRHRRLEALRSQLPDALELMSRILRAGQTISQAMQAVATEFTAPIGSEFGYCYEQQNLGLSMDVALRDLAKRTGLLEIRIFVLGLLVHRRSGGNLTELLDNLATIIRERFKIRGKIKALTAEGRFQAAALLVLPPAAFLILLFVNRPYAAKLLDHPYLILTSLLSMAFGAFWIRKIVNFDF